MKPEIFVRWAQAGDLDRVRAMWSYAFADSPAFVDWAFSTYVRPEEVLVAGFDGIPYASLQLIDYPIAAPGGKIRAKYVVGVDCLPEARGMGLTQALMTAIHEGAKDWGVDLYLLMPFEASFYLAYDYAFGTFHARMDLPMDQLPRFSRQAGTYDRHGLEVGMGPGFQAQLQGIYQDWQAETADFYQVRDDRQWDAFCDDLALEGGSLAFWTPAGQDKPQAYVAYTMPDRHFHIRELAASSQAGYEALIYYVASHRSQKDRVAWSAPVWEALIGQRPADKDGISLYPFMMFRLQAVEKMGLLAKRLPDQDLDVKVDGQVYRWLKGSRDVVALETASPGGIDLSLKDLNHLIFNPSFPLGASPDAKALRACFDGLRNYLNSYF